jgi:two-component system chemotaxis response regulator CheB
MIRVFVVDDSVVARQIVIDALRSDRGIEVCGFAQNGRVALEKIPDAKPDVITLDIEMPEMDGLAVLTELRKTQPRLPVIMFSSLTERGADVTLEALARGASDYVCKPTGQRSVQQTMETIREALIPKIYALHGRATQPTAASLRAAPPSLKASMSGTAELSPSARPVQLVVIAVSTGGPAALAQVVPQLPPGLRQAVLIVQHMPPVFTKVLAQRLAASSPLKVREATHQDTLTPGLVLIAPGDFHMRVAGSPREAWVALDRQPLENGCRPAADPLFVSAAQVFGSGVLAVVMTGLGKDGTKGAAAVCKASGQVWAQDEASSTVWGMPGSVVEAGLAQRVLPLSQLAKTISKACEVSNQSVPSAQPKPSIKKVF